MNSVAAGCRSPFSLETSSTGGGSRSRSRAGSSPWRWAPIGNILFGGTGFFIDTFSARHQEGILWLHGYGNVFEVTLKPGEQIDIEPGGWIYKDRTVQMEAKFQKLTAGLFAGTGRIVWNRFTGPGRIGLQSMYLHMPTEE